MVNLKYLTPTLMIKCSRGIIVCEGEIRLLLGGEEALE